MDQDRYLAHLDRDQRAFGDCLAGDLTVPVAPCPGWTLYDLADHLGRGNLWAAAAVTERRGDHESPAAPRGPGETRAWFAETADVLLRALGRDPSTPAWTIASPETVGFWRRRRALEALVHRWDAEHATGRTSGLDPELADDGVAEVVDTIAPRQVRLGRAPTPALAVRLSATDTGSTWHLGPGAPVATVHAPAEELLLLLWRRLPVDPEALRWDGDRAAVSAVLDSGLVP